jgi:hypothetical protein
MFVFSIAHPRDEKISINRSTFNNSMLNTGIVNYNTTKKIFQFDKESINNIKEIPELVKTIKLLTSKVDTANLQSSALMKILEANKKSQDSATIAQNALIEELIMDRQLYRQMADSAIFLLSLQKEIQAKKWNYLPFGIYQFRTQKDIGKGILFSVTEAGLLGTGIGYCISAQRNLRKHKDPKYEDWERDRFYDKYESQRGKSKWWFAGAALMIGLNYCDNFNWFRKNNIKPASILTFDWQGKPQMTMALSIKF